MIQERSDPSREYSEREQRTLAANLLKLSESIHDGSLRGRAPNTSLLCWMHEQLFKGVRDHAGIIRKVGFGSTFLTFGPNRSVEAAKVPDALLDLFRDLQRALATLDPSKPDFDLRAIRLAAKVHADAIRIHPFEDGNGRASRSLLNWILVRLGLRPIAFEVARQDYLNCLNHYYASNDIQPLVDLCIRVYPVKPDS